MRAACSAVISFETKKKEEEKGVNSYTLAAFRSRWMVGLPEHRPLCK